VIKDLRTVPSGTEIPADVCIIGAGAAGITLANAIGGGPGRTVLLESGGLEPDPAVQALAEGVNAGRPYFALDQCRLRYFGGSTNHWVGHCGPLDPIDFRPRRWVSHSGWPISREELSPYYAAAQVLCELGPFTYDPSEWFAQVPPLPALDPGKLDYCMWQFSPPTRFGQRYHDALATSDRTDVFLHATATRLDTDAEGRRVTGIAVRSLDGPSVSVRPRVTVVAGGGIENARLLLASGRVGAGGIGNSWDQVGRYFMDHPHVETGEVLLLDEGPVLSLFTERTSNGTRVRAGLRPTEEAQAREAILNCGINISRLALRDTGYDAARHLLGGLRRGDWPERFGQSVLRTIADLDAVRGTLDRLLGRSYRRPARVILFARAEQAPNPESRVTLSESTDPLGIPRAELRWRLLPTDLRSVRRSTMLVAEEIGRLGLGRVRLAEWLREREPDWPEALVGGCHHIGTTRMSSDPRHGVVDENCRVHGMANLYVTGSSTFPTSGFMNPTLTIVALALRLADHLPGAVLAGS